MIIPSKYNSSEHFNALPSIENANRTLEAGNLLKEVEKILSPIFLEEGMLEYWGIGLLHKHWRLYENEICLQQVFDTPDGNEYITLPKHNYGGACWPSIIKLDIQSGEPVSTWLEFSTDTVVCDAFKKLDINPRFVGRVASALVDQNLNSTFGLSAIRKPSSPQRELVEYNYRERISILRESSTGRFDDKSIQTSWSFSPLPGSNVTIMTGCWARCVVPKSGAHYPDHADVPDPQPDSVN
jgi:hypothetical protein